MYRLRFCLPSTSSARGFAAEAPQRARRVAVPNAIKRSPTAVLEALAGTVGTDTTAPHYSFIDDPTTIPSTIQAKKTYYMAKELGKRAARQLAAEWPTLFAYDKDFPRLAAFRPQKLPDPLQIEPTEANLKSMIDAREVRDAVMLYERIRSENVEVSNEVQLDLFRLVTYYNAREVPFSEEVDWHGLRAYGISQPSQWEQAGIADLLYETLEKNEEVNSTLIAGLCKHASHESVTRARNVLQTMLKSKQVPSIEAWNGLITVSTWSQVQEISKQMAKYRVRPDHGTFEAMLTVVTKLPLKERRGHIEQIFAEIRAVGQKASLLSYALALQAAVPEERQEGENPDTKRLAIVVNWLSEIVEELEAAPSIELHSSYDSLFFLVAMQTATQANSLSLARRVEALYTSEKNQVKFPSFTEENTFYTAFLNLIVRQVEDINEVEKTYKSFVPRLVGVSRNLCFGLLDRLKNQPKWSLSQRVVDDGICARFLADVRMSGAIRDHLLNIPFLSLSVMERDEYTELVKKIVDVWIELSNFTKENQKRLQIKLSPLSAAESALLLLRVGETEKAWKLLELLLDEEAKFSETSTVMATGFIRQEILNQLFEEALRDHSSEHAVIVLELLAGQLTRSKLEPLVKRIEEKCPMNPEQRKLIEGFVRLRPQ